MLDCCTAIGVADLTWLANLRCLAQPEPERESSDGSAIRARVDASVDSQRSALAAADGVRVRPLARP